MLPLNFSEQEEVIIRDSVTAMEESHLRIYSDPEKMEYIKRETEARNNVKNFDMSITENEIAKRLEAFSAIRKNPKYLIQKFDDLMLDQLFVAISKRYNKKNPHLMGLIYKILNAREMGFTFDRQN